MNRVSLKIKALLPTAILTVSCMANCAWGANAPKNVYFGEDKRMHSDFNQENGKGYDFSLVELQPGDSETFVVNVTNQYPGTTDWYMTNEVISSLEQSAAAHTSGEEGATEGGAYTYILTYKGPGTANEPNGVLTLYNSDIVGGELENVTVTRPGLREATEDLEKYFLLDTLKQNEGGVVELTVSLDGESQGNAYQDTLADLRMNFAVELKESTPTTTVTPTPGTPTTPRPGTSTTTTGTTVVKTGDNTNLMPYFVAAIVSGIILCILGIIVVRYRKKMKGDDE